MEQNRVRKALGFGISIDAEGMISLSDNLTADLNLTT